ncbi:MAG: hypothetical protein JJ863_23910 [Deltaproteobacteria bacterium]|nr:hypothetical protein [Deltaproteobacteria bacterium]
MTKSVLTMLALATLTSACGASANLDVRASLDGHEVYRYDRLIDAGLEEYEAELEAAAQREYPSRLAALEAARDLGSESRMIHHIRASLASEGLTVANLCQFSAEHPGYANGQRSVYRERMARWEELLEEISTATVVPMPESGEALTASAVLGDPSDG